MILLKWVWERKKANTNRVKMTGLYGTSFKDETKD